MARSFNQVIKSVTNLRTLYVYRSLLNPKDVMRWLQSQGVTYCMHPDDMHITIVYSGTKVDWSRLSLDKRHLVVQSPSANYSLDILGDKGALALIFNSDEAKRRHEYYLGMGAKSDYNSFLPHMTLLYVSTELPLSDYAVARSDAEVKELRQQRMKNANTIEIEPYDGILVFGPEKIEEVSDGWSDAVRHVEIGRSTNDPVDSKPDEVYPMWKSRVRISKVDSDQRIAYGWASVIEEDGRPVVDHQGDILDENTLQTAVHEFISKRTAGFMHVVSGVGEVVDSMLFTKDVQKALGIDLGKVGWFIGVKVTDPSVWGMVKSGSLSEFSIGGTGVREKV